MSGESKIPVARVNRIVKADKEVRLCSKEAVFLISKATEFMIARMSQQAYQHARLAKKSSKLVKYADLAATCQTDQWYYLGEVIPPSRPLHEALSLRQHNEDVLNAPAAVTSAAPERAFEGKRVLKSKGKKGQPLVGVDGEVAARKTRGKKIRLPAGEGGSGDDDGDDDASASGGDSESAYEDDGGAGAMDVDG
ncbi:hypothetical protein JCM3775_001915 [Rhodotorula graminis]|uniref:Transcription factor CBF/NF-Y/archaeal histone domain-containing protein n=1 Tax=Rhodotorula graminis (strain WP1) TaxID=578459 RepID=A0A0P9EX63_RHOGW|nr:uncharacterized protein RHOBADRAFT_56346 [Rhodotorula graminis WP1]KPV71722.1 hypothetical protein RHOBADRAFT_56346 [Rhodotorula graminis WP1]